MRRRLPYGASRYRLFIEGPGAFRVECEMFEGSAYIGRGPTPRSAENAIRYIVFPERERPAHRSAELRSTIFD